MIARKGLHPNYLPKIDSMLVAISTMATNDQRRYLILLGGLLVFALIISRYQFQLGTYESSVHLFGLPLLSVGDNAFGVIAVGGIAKGIIAIGGVSVGVVAVGGIAAGVFSLSGLALGLVLALGGVSLGFYSFGGLSAGAFSYAGGGIAIGVYKASGQQSEGLLFEHG